MLIELNIESPVTVMLYTLVEVGGELIVLELATTVGSSYEAGGSLERLVDI